MPHSRFMTRPFLVTIAVGVVAAWAPSQSDSEAFFEAKIRPLIAAKCASCHSEALGKRKGGLSLDRRSSILTGGETGAAAVAGDPEQSLLIKAVRYGDAYLQMPPTGKLSDAEIADLARWVKEGMVDPRESVSTAAESRPVAAFDADAAARAHWAFIPPADPRPPAVEGEAWCRTSFDRFIRAGLEAKGLEPAPEADRRTLIRRASFDLTGLPPTEAEIDAFLRDQDPNAYEKLLDRLLASPHFGERQARWWLDLARYADSNGLDENLAMANAWRYRDWVIRAFNEDLGYDRFLTYQLAGDLLPEPDDETELADRLIATGFLVLGPKMLAEQDKPKLVMDIVDEQIDVAGKAFLGLTISCARCHDHKFDPITARDYYALAGTLKSTSVLRDTAFVSRWREAELAKKARVEARQAHAKELTAGEKSLEVLRRAADEAVSAAWRGSFSTWLVQGARRAREVRVVEAESFARGNVVVDKNHWGRPETPIVRTGNGEQPQWAEYDLPADLSGRYEVLGRAAAEEERPVVVKLDGRDLAGDAFGKVTGSWHPEGQTWRRLGSVDLAAGPHVLRFERAGPSIPHIDAFALVPVAEVPGLPSDVLALAAAVFVKPAPHEAPLIALIAAAAVLPPETFEDGVATAAARLMASKELSPLLEGVLAAPAPRDLEELAARHQAALKAVELAWTKARAKKADVAKLDDPDLDGPRQLLFGKRSPFEPEGATRRQHLPAEKAAELAKSEARVDELRRTLPPPFETALAAREDKPVDLPVHVRGSHLSLEKEAVPRGVPAVLASFVKAPKPKPESSGRLELAAWLVQPDHPLTARVMANRIWRVLFGQGIVRSPSNFGRRGEPPTHPELLDHLAREFVRGGWSIKGLFRSVMLSAAYRQSARFDERGAAADPENLLLWRQNRRRLEAESMRDAILLVAGSLDRTMGGTLLKSGNGDYVTNDQSGNAANYDAPRRTIYLPVVRNALYDLFSTFDYPDAGMPIEQRSSTVDPNQALLLMNSPLSTEQAKAFARLILADEALDDAGRVARAWLRAYARPPRDDETRGALDFVKSQSTRLARLGDGAREAAWQSLCQALFASNEFLYVD